MKKNLINLIALLLVVCCSASCMTLKKKNRLLRAEAARKLGEAYLAEGKHSSAYIELKKSKELNPKDPYLYLAFGDFYFSKEKYDLAIDNFKKAKKIKPDLPAVWNNMGMVYVAMEEWDNAIKCFNKVLDSFIYATPHYPLFGLGRAYFGKKDYKTALKYFKESIDEKPGFLVALHWLGLTHLELGNGPEAVNTLIKAIKINSEASILFLDLGKAYILSKKFKLASMSLNKVIKLDKKSPEAVEAKTILNQIKTIDFER